MKKFLIILCAFLLLGTEIAWAQAKHPVFSSALGGGGYGYGYGYGYARRGVRRSVYRPYEGTRSAYVVAQPAKWAREKIVIKYEPGQIALANEHMEKLMPMIRRIQDGKVRSVEIIGICRDYNTIANREANISKILRSYAPSLNIRHREISGAAVIDSNDNTVEFVEYW